MDGLLKALRNAIVITAGLGQGSSLVRDRSGPYLLEGTSELNSYRTEPWRLPAVREFLSSRLLQVPAGESPR